MHCLASTLLHVKLKSMLKHCLGLLHRIVQFCEHPLYYWKVQMNKWPCNCVFHQCCYHMSLNDADTMAGPDMPLAPSGEPWFIIHFVLTAPFLSSLFRSCQKSRRGWNWSPVKEIPPGGAIDRCGAPGATDPMSGWSIDGDHQPSRVNLPLLSNSTLADANKCCSVIAEHLYSLNVQFLCSIF